MTRQFSSDAEIERVARGFLDRRLAKHEWTHAAHFAVTLWLMRHRPMADLGQEMPRWIRAFNESVGTLNNDSGGYHETITQASLAAAASHGASHEGESLAVVLEKLMASPLGKPEWLLDYWSRECLFSVAARRSWLPPDIKPLPYEVRPRTPSAR